MHQKAFTEKKQIYYRQFLHIKCVFPDSLHSLHSAHSLPDPNSLGQCPFAIMYPEGQPAYEMV